MLNEELHKINHSLSLLQDCIEQLGRNNCDYISMIDLRDAFHTLKLAITSQKILWNNTILWITHVPLVTYGYGHER